MSLLHLRPSSEPAHRYLPMCGPGSTTSHLLGSVNVSPAAGLPVNRQGFFSRTEAEGELRRYPHPTHLSNISRQAHKKHSGSSWFFGPAFLMLLPWAPLLLVRSQYQSLQQELLNQTSSSSESLNNLRQINEELSHMDREARRLQKQNDALIEVLKKNGVGYVQDTNDPDYLLLEQQEEELLERIDLLQSHVQGESRKAILDKSGDGPHFVEFNLSDPLGATNRGFRFVVELAPIHLMPHAVHHFLQMVSNNLWDGLALIHQEQSSNLIQAVPLIAKTTQRVNDRFEKAKITKLAFAEHHQSYPRLSYTLAFSGSPGGPDFYISLENENATHAEEKQIYDEGESCFARVIEGKDVLDDFAQNRGKTKLGILAIDSVRLVT